MIAQRECAQDSLEKLLLAPLNRALAIGLAAVCIVFAVFQISSVNDQVQVVSGAAQNQIRSVIETALLQEDVQAETVHGTQLSPRAPRILSRNPAGSCRCGCYVSRNTRTMSRTCPVTSLPTAQFAIPGERVWLRFTPAMAWPSQLRVAGFCWL